MLTLIYTQLTFVAIAFLEVKKKLKIFIFYPKHDPFSDPGANLNSN